MRFKSSKSPTIPDLQDPANVSEATVFNRSQLESSAIQSVRSVNQDSPASLTERPAPDPEEAENSDASPAVPSAAESREVFFETASSPSNPDSLVLSRFDQPTLVVLLLISSLAVIGWSLWQSSLLRSRIIDIDEARRSPLVFVVDLNSASAAELANLPGVGPKLAEAMLRYRQQHGRFATPEDLLNVSGIGEAKLKAILPYLRPLGPMIEPNSPPTSPSEPR